MTAETLAILSLDDDGHGRTASGEAFPMTVPGDRVVVDGDGRVTLIDPSPQRATPPCPLFGQCGGCSHQHLSDTLYADWMVGRVERAFARKGLTPPIKDLVRSPLAARRRVTLTAERTGEGIRVGYTQSRSHTVVDVTQCPAMAPPLAACLPALRTLAADAAGASGSARLTATLCANGVDAALTTPKPKPKKGRTKRRPDARPPPLATASDAIIRIALNGETLLQRDTPVVRFDGVDVPLPPGAFLQATREGEDGLIKAVREGVGTALRVADCFSGLGTFAAPLSRTASV
ncbi:MAG: RNA methyltransferase, partial [Pseudomonadota bacterium]